MNEEEIFDQALARSCPAERAAYLDQVCADKPAVRAAVEALLRANVGASGFLDRPAPALVVTVDASPSESPGAMVGPYKLLEQIGEGGFGIVFMAEQHAPLRRRVALKVLKPGMDTKQVIARFEAERQALALMEHPNIARVLDGGETASGRPYFVMELVRGISITEFCDQNQLSVRQRLELFVSVCQAVQHAHQKGIIHRDLKPSNVMVTLQDDKAVVKVIDFGIAKVTGQQLTEKTVFTGFAQMIGTPLYMAPEQAALSNVDVDTRSDVYALGVLLYELLTGTTPFDKERFKEVGYDEIRRIIREEEPPRPSTRISTLGKAATTVWTQRESDPKRLSQLFRGELDWVVMKALDKDRNRRYETASGLAADVQHYLNDEPVLACPPSAWYRLRKFARRNKGRLAVAVGVFLAVTVMAASISWAISDRAGRRATLAAQVRESLNTARILIADNKLNSARRKLVEARAQLGNDRSGLGNLAAELEAVEAELDRFQQVLDLIDRAHQAETAPVLEAVLAMDGPHGGARPLPSTKAGERRPAAAVPFLLEALQRYQILERDDWHITLEGGLLAKEQVKQIRRLAYEELLWLADDVLRRKEEHRSGKKLSLEVAARAALVYLGKAESAHRPTQALYVLRARCRKALGQGAAAQAEKQLADQTPATLAMDYILRGVAAYDAKQLVEGVQAFETALRVEPTHYWSLMRLGYCLCDLGQGPEDFAGAVRVFMGCILKRPDHAHAYFCRALAYSKLRRDEEAVADHSRAIELDPKHSGAWNSRGVSNSKLGQWGKAFADFSKAIELDPKSVDAWNNRGIAYSKLGQHDKALADFSKAIELDPKSVDAWNNLGNALYYQKDLPEAVAAYKKALAIEPQDAKAWAGLGNALYYQKDLPGAVAAYRKALAIDPQYAEAWYYLGNALRDQKDSPGAVGAYRNALKIEPNNPEANCNLGLVLRRQGCFTGALSFLKEGHRLGSQRPGWSYPSASWVQECRKLLKQEQRAQAVAKGEAAIAMATEPLELAQFCRKFHRNHTAARLYAAAFAAQPSLAGDLAKGHRYHAAGAAALAAAGQGHDASKLSDNDRPALRRQALDWLRSDLKQLTQTVANHHAASTAQKPPPTSPLEKLAGQTQRPGAADVLLVCDRLQGWKNSPDLGSVRHDKELARLAAEEQKDWRQLWHEVQALHRQARACFLERQLSGSLTFQQKEQTHDVTLQAGNTYIFDLESTSFDPMLRLEDAAGNKLAENDDIDPMVNLNSRILYLSPHDGTYRLVVTACQGQGVGGYTLTIREFANRPK
jgi:serine/threonine protein kinase/Flp pilus assembly protein TadD